MFATMREAKHLDPLGIAGLAEGTHANHFDHRIRHVSVTIVQGQALQRGL